MFKKRKLRKQYAKELGNVIHSYKSELLGRATKSFKYKSATIVYDWFDADYSPGFWVLRSQEGKASDIQIINIYRYLNKGGE